MAPLRFLLLSVAFSSLAALGLGAQSVLAAIGDTVMSNGSPAGTLVGIQAHAVTDASDYTIHGFLSGGAAADEALFGPSGVFLREGDLVPGPNANGAVITGFDGIAQGPSGKLAYLVEGSAAGSDPAYEAIFLDNEILLRTGIPADGAGFGAGSEYADIIAFSLGRGATSCSSRILARVDVAVGATLIEAVVEVRAGCEATIVPERVLAVGDFLCTDPACTSTTQSVVDLGDGSDALAINAAGETLVALRLITPNGIEGGVARDGVLDACDGCSVCGGALLWGDLGEELSLADNGERAIRGSIASGEDAVIADCGVLAKVGDQLPSLPGAITSIGRVESVQDGTVYWGANYLDPSPSGGSAILRELQPVVRRGVTTIAGSPVIAIGNSAGSFAPTGSTGLLAFRGVLANGTDGVFVVPTTPRVVGWSIVPTTGCSSLNTASLSYSSGTSQVGSTFSLAIDQAQTTGAVPQLFFANRAFRSDFQSGDCGYLWGFGEAILGLELPNPVFGPVGGPWIPGSPQILSLALPSNGVNLIGETWYVQALFFDPVGMSSPEFIRSTNAMAVTFGSP